MSTAIFLLRVVALERVLERLLKCDAVAGKGIWQKLAVLGAYEIGYKFRSEPLIKWTFAFLVFDRVVVNCCRRGIRSFEVIGTQLLYAGLLSVSGLYVGSLQLTGCMSLRHPEKNHACENGLV